MAIRPDTLPHGSRLAKNAVRARYEKRTVGEGGSVIGRVIAPAPHRWLHLNQVV